MGFKMKKDLWGLYHSAEGATRQGTSAAPITKKASSPLKMNADLVAGAGAVAMSKGFVNAADTMEKPSLSEQSEQAYPSPPKVPAPDPDEGNTVDLGAVEEMETAMDEGLYEEDEELDEEF